MICPKCGYSAYSGIIFQCPGCAALKKKEEEAASIKKQESARVQAVREQEAKDAARVQAVRAQIQAKKDLLELQEEIKTVTYSLTLEYERIRESIADPALRSFIKIHQERSEELSSRLERLKTKERNILARF